VAQVDGDRQRPPGLVPRGALRHVRSLGAYSHAGGIWEGKPIEGYAEHLMRRMKVPSAVYKEKVVSQFNPTAFNADEWISLAKKAGMAYFIITSKHHDGFAMYDSDVSDYNVVKATPWKHDR
jgi:hypothetical protein